MFKRRTENLEMLAAHAAGEANEDAFYLSGLSVFQAFRLSEGSQSDKLSRRLDASEIDITEVTRVSTKPRRSMSLTFPFPPVCDRGGRRHACEMQSRTLRLTHSTKRVMRFWSVLRAPLAAPKKASKRWRGTLSKLANRLLP